MEENKKRGLSVAEYIAAVLVFAILVVGCAAFTYITLNKANNKKLEAQAKAIEVAIKYGEEIGEDNITACLKALDVKIDSGAFTYDNSTGKVTPGEGIQGTVLVFNSGNLTVADKNK